MLQLTVVTVVSCVTANSSNIVTCVPVESLKHVLLPVESLKPVLLPVESLKPVLLPVESLKPVLLPVESLKPVLIIEVVLEGSALSACEILSVIEQPGIRGFQKLTGHSEVLYWGV